MIINDREELIDRVASSIVDSMDLRDLMTAVYNNQLVYLDLLTDEQLIEEIRDLDILNLEDLESYISDEKLTTQGEQVDV